MLTLGCGFADTHGIEPLLILLDTPAVTSENGENGEKVCHN